MSTVINPKDLQPLPPEIAKQWIDDDPEPPHFFKQVQKAYEVREAREIALAAADRYSGLRDGLKLASTIWGICLGAIVLTLVAVGGAIWVWSAFSGLPALLVLAPITIGAFILYRASMFCFKCLADYRAHVQSMDKALDRFHVLDAEYKEFDKKTAAGIQQVDDPTEAPPFIAPEKKA
jgi:hypothetical protein